MRRNTARQREPAAPTYSGREGSCARCRLGGRTRSEAALPIGSDGQAGASVLALEVGEVAEDLILGHAAGEVIKDIVDGDAQTADAQPPAAFAGLHRDP